ncbi:hypothetical protein Cgig2_008367 [Carnegiea gigantea]|uniref:Uncharacterized protein n=1 Tax=Carnegiea gigantea TaxID=171969 RepID=A0A9Q1KAL6_9CARY|nr:hypothetical protein Cgig2_008367 [Carnegiea gigantea]
MGCEPSHRHVPIVSHRHSDEVREVTRPDRDDRSRGEKRDQLHTEPLPKPGMTGKVNHDLNAKCNAFLMYCLVRGAGANFEAPRGDLHEQNGHTTAECRELRKALHELADKGKIDRLLKRGPQFLRKECELARPEPLRKSAPLKNNGHHCQWIREGYHSVRLEGSTSRATVGSHG